MNKNMKKFFFFMLLSLGFVCAQTTPFTSGADAQTITSFTNGQTIDAGAGTDSLTVTTFNSNVGTITISNLETLTINPTTSAQGSFALAGSGGITVTHALASSQVNKLTYNFSTTATSDTLNLSGSYTRVLAAKAGGVELGVLTGLDTLNITGDIDVRSGGSAAAWLHIGNALFRAVDNVARTINISGDITLRSISAPTTLGGGNFNQAGSMVGFQLTRRFTNLGATTDGASTIVITGSVNAILDGTDNNFWRLQNSLGFALGDQADTVTFRNSNSRVVRGELVRFGAGSDTLVLDSTSGSSSLTGILRGSNGGAAHVGGGIYDLGGNANNNHEVGYFSNPFTGLETLRKTGSGTYLLGFSVALGEAISRSSNQYSSTVTVAGTNVNIEAGVLIVAGDDGIDTTESGFSADGASADAAAVLRAGSFTISDGAVLQLGQIETIGSWQVTRSGSVTGAVTINSGGRLDVEAGGSVTGTVTVNSGGILDIGTRRSLSGATVIANNGGADGVSFASGGGGILEIAYASGGTVFSDAAVLDGSETLTINVTGITAGEYIVLIGAGATGTGSNYTLQVGGQANSNFVVNSTAVSGAIILSFTTTTTTAIGITIATPAGGTTFDVGTNIALSATVNPGGSDQLVTWSSGDEAKATVNAITGVVTALTPGTVTITATSVVDNSLTSTIDLTIPSINEATYTATSVTSSISDWAGVSAAIDGNKARQGWVSTNFNFRSPPAVNLTFDLGSFRSVNTVLVWVDLVGANIHHHSIRNIEVFVSSDNTSFTSAGSYDINAFRASDHVNTNAIAVKLTSTIQGRYIRLRVTSNYSGLGSESYVNNGLGDRYRVREIEFAIWSTGIEIQGATNRTGVVGESETLVANVQPSMLNNPAALTWTSSATNIATITNGGVITFRAAGTTTITVTATTSGGTHTATVNYTVTAQIPSTLGGNDIANNSFSGTSTSAQALVVNGTLNLAASATLKATTVVFSGSDKITGATGATIEIGGAMTTVSSANTIDVANIKLQTGSSGALYGGASANTITISGGSATVNAGAGVDVVVVSSIFTGDIDGEAGSDTLRLSGGTVSGSLSNFEVLDVTSASVLNTNLNVGSASLSGVLTGTGNLTVAGNATAGSGQFNISGSLTLRAQTSALTLGDNVTTVYSVAGSHTEGAITLGSGATNAIIRVLGAGTSDIYSGNLTGSGDDNLFLRNVTFAGTATGFDSLVSRWTGSVVVNVDLGSTSKRLALFHLLLRNSSLSISTGKTAYFSNVTINSDISGAGTVDIAGVITGSSSVAAEIDVATVVLRSSSSGGVYFGSNVDDVIFDGVSYIDDLTFVTAASTNITLRNGATLSSTITGSIDDFTVSGTGTNVLDVDLSPGGATMISGVLQIALGHTLTTKSGETNQVTSSGVLDISKLAASTAGVGSNGLTVASGGTLALGTAKGRNASNITLTKGSSTSSIITLNLGTNAVTSTTAIFSTLPTLAGTGTVALNISGSLAVGASHVLASGDVTGDYRIGSGSFELYYDNTNTVIRRRLVVLDSSNAGLTSRGASLDQDLTDGSSSYEVVVKASFNKSGGNINVLGDITVESGATTGTLTAANITVTSATVGALTVSGSGNISITQNDNAAAGGNLSLGGAITGGGTGTLSFTNNDANSAIVLNSATSTISGFTNLSLAGTGGFTLNNSLTISGNTALGAVLSGTGHLTTATLSGSSNPNIASLTISGSQANAISFGSGVNTLTLSGGGSGAISLGGGNDVIVVSSVYTGALDGEAGSDTLRLSGGTVSGTLSNFESLDVTSASVLNTNLSLGSVSLSGVLTGTGNLQVTGNATAGAGQFNISGTLTLRGQTSDLTLGNNVTTLYLGVGSHTEGAISLGSGATNATISVSGTGASDIYSGDLTGSGDDNLSFNNATFTGTATGFDSLTVGTGSTVLNVNLGSGTARIAFSNSSTGSFSISSGKTLYVSSVALSGDISGAGTLDIGGAITGSSSTSTELDVATVVLNTGSFGNIFFGSNVDDVIFDGDGWANSFTFTSSAGTNITLRNGASLYATLTNSIGGFTVSGTGTNILGIDLSPGGGTTISGVLQIAVGHTLTTASGETNQVSDGGTLDISQLASGTAGVGSNGLTVASGGTLALGTAKGRNASNITLTRGSSSSSIITLNLGTNAVTSTTAIFHTQPVLAGTGTVALNISGSLAVGASHVLASGDVTGDYRIGSGFFELHHDGTNTVIRRLRLLFLNSTDNGLTSRGPASDQDLTDGTSSYAVRVESSFNNSSANLHTNSIIVVEAGATVGALTAANITVTSATVGALTVSGSGNISITQNDNAAAGGNLSLGGAITGGTGTLSFTNNDANSAIVLNSATSTISGFANLSLAGTGGFTLNNSLTISGNTALGAVLSGTGHLTTATLSGSSNPNIASLTISGSQANAISFGSGVNTVTLSGGGSGAISLGGGNDVIVVSSVYTGALDGEAGSDTLRLSGGTVSGSLSNFESLDVTSASVLNTNLSLGSVSLSGVLTGTGNLQVTGNATAGAGQFNISGTLTLQGQTSDLTLGNNVTTLYLGVGSHTEGAISLGSGATNATISVSGTGASDIYSGDLTGSGDDNLSFNNATFTGTATGFDSLTVGTGSTVLNVNLGSGTTRLVFSNSSTGSFSISSGKTLYVSSVALSGDISGAGTLDIGGAITGSSSTSTEIDVATVVLSSGSSGGAYFGSNVDDVIFDGVSYSDSLTFVTAASSNITLRNGASLSSTLTGSIGDFTVSGTGTNVLDVNLSVGGGTTISGVLQIAVGHTLTTASGETNQVSDGGTLDISKLAASTAGVGSNGLTIVAGGILAIGTAESRNASNITLTRGATASASSTVSINLGVDASTSTTAIFSTLPTLTGTGKVTLNISGNLLGGASQVLASGDVTGDYRVGSVGDFELYYDNTNTVIKISNLIV